MASLRCLLAALVAAGATAQPAPTRARPAAADTVTHDDAHRLEVAYTTLSSISGQVRNVFDSREVAEELPDIDENLHAIRHSVEETGQVVDIKQLQMCQLMLVNIQEQLAEWRTALGGAHEALEGMQARLAGLAHPPLHGQLPPMPPPGPWPTPTRPCKRGNSALAGCWPSGLGAPASCRRRWPPATFKPWNCRTRWATRCGASGAPPCRRPTRRCGPPTPPAPPPSMPTTPPPTAAKSSTSTSPTTGITGPSCS